MPGLGQVIPERVVIDNPDREVFLHALQRTHRLGVDEYDRFNRLVGQVAPLNEGQLSTVEGEIGAHVAVDPVRQDGNAGAV